jgi:FkbM family methyltransferase
MMNTSTLRFLWNHPVGRRQRLKTTFRLLRWQLLARTRAEVELEWLNGIRVSARRGMTGITGNLYVGLHEFPEMSFLIHYLRTDDLFFDVGANVGSYTLLAAFVSNAQVVSVEPSPTTAKVLRSNLALNHAAPRVEVKEFAVASSKGFARFSRCLDSVNHVVAASENIADVITVATTTIDDLASDRVPALIKLDIEGHEEEALRGASKTLADTSLNAVLIELDSPFVRDTMSAHGFTRLYYDPFNRKLSENSFSHKQCNSLFIRDREFVQGRVESSPLFDVFGTLI